MKLCPTCRSTFTDETLSFCLQDGTPLVALATENLSQHSTDPNRDAPTLQMNEAQTEGLIDEITLERKRQSSQEPMFQQQPVFQPQPQARKGGNIFLTLGVIVIAFCLLALVVIGAAFLAKDYLFANQNADNKNIPSENKPDVKTSPTPKPSPSPTPTPKPSGISVTASSTRVPYKDIIYNASFLVDGNLSTAWIEGANGKGIGESVSFNFGKTVTLKKIIVYPGYFKSESIWKKNNRLATVTFYFSNGSSQEFSFEDKMEPQTIDVGAIKTSYVKLVIENVYAGETDFEDTAISELNFVF